MHDILRSTNIPFAVVVDLLPVFSLECRTSGRQLCSRCYLCSPISLQNNASKLLLAIMESRHDSENAERILYNMRPKELVRAASFKSAQGVVVGCCVTVCLLAGGSDKEGLHAGGDRGGGATGG